MVGLSLETWVSLGTLIAVGTGIVTLMRSETRSIRADMRDLKTDMRDLKTDIRRVDDRVQHLDDRVYALATGLKPTPERADGTQTDR
ncbi:MAG TPA: hypothetical protein VGC45_11675 [Gryllotalpicola sp.]